MRCAPSPRAVTLAALLLVLSGPAQAQRVPGAKVEAAVRTSIARYLERSHLRPDLVDADALAAEARRRSEETGSIVWLDDWLGSELHRATWAFAPADARADPAVRYGLPFDPVFPRFLTQAPGGAWSHTGSNHYSFDFVMPVGTAVLAAREGVVARVIDGFTEGSTDPDLKRRANAVYVLHADGTVGRYVHVAPGIPVKEDERVSRGQVIASSGLTGWTAVPHLCFSVLRKGPDGLETIPIRFARPGGAGFVPELGAWVGSPPRPTLELVLHADGAPVAPGTVLPARSGQTVRLRVEARPPGRPARDVTGHPRLQLVSMTPWTLAVLGPGEVTFRPTEQFPPDWGPDGDLAAVGVFFLNGEEREVGLGKVEFHLTDRVRNAEP